MQTDANTICELTRFPLLRFLSALHCGYGGITDIQDGFFLY